MAPAWPAFNASLNAASALLITAGAAAIWRRKTRLHAACMAGAVAVSGAFLVSYVGYHLEAGAVRFAGEGWPRAVYLAVLVSHSALAVIIVPLVARTVWLAVRRRFDAHRRIARWTLPLWLYVSVTGVLVYWMLYHWQGNAA
ncbi:MAG TPA: DUF420 domain-containing protein [bacterium]